MKKFTVLLLYPDYLASNYGEETYLAHMTAKSVPRAIVAAQREAFDENKLEPDDGEPIDFAPLMVIEGHHDDIRGRA